MVVSCTCINKIIMVSCYIAHIQCSARFTHFTPGNWTCSFMFLFQLPFLEHTALAAILELGTNRTHCHLCPNRYWFKPESSEACEDKVPCPRTQHRNNVSILRGKKHDISLKNPLTSGIWIRTAGSDIVKAPRSSHCATSLSTCAW